MESFPSFLWSTHCMLCCAAMGAIRVQGNVRRTYVCAWVLIYPLIDSESRADRNFWIGLHAFGSSQNPPTPVWWKNQAHQLGIEQPPSHFLKPSVRPRCRSPAMASSDHIPHRSPDLLPHFPARHATDGDSQVPPRSLIVLAHQGCFASSLYCGPTTPTYFWRCYWHLNCDC